ERLQRSDLSRLERNNGLVMEDELIALDGLAQVALQLQALHGRRMHARLEERVATLAPSLSGIHRDVRVPQQLVGALPRGRGGGDANAASHVDLSPVDLHGRLEGGLDSLGDLNGVRDLPRLLEQDRELVSAEASHCVARADAVEQPPRHGREQLVALIVSEAVVDRLESVQIEE